MMLWLISAVPVVPSRFRPASTATPFWQPPNGVSWISVMWFDSISADPPVSTRTP